MQVPSTAALVHPLLDEGQDILAGDGVNDFEEGRGGDEHADPRP